MSRGTFEDFLDQLRAFESGVDWERYQAGIITEWQIRNWVGDETWEAWEVGDITWTEMQYRSMNSLGFVGYQFGEALLIDLGYYQDDVFYGNGAASNTWDGTWTGKNGATSLEAFMTAEVQEPAIRDAFGYNLSVIENGLAQQGKSLDDFLGTTASYQSGGQTVLVELTLTGILAAAHLRGAWGTLALLQAGAVSTDENGTSILQYIEQFGGYDAPTVAELIAAWEQDAGGPDPVTGGDDYALTWSWGSHQVLEGFDPETDRIALGNVFGPADIALEEVDGSTIIYVLFGPSGAQQSLTLEGVPLFALSSGNFTGTAGAGQTIEEALEGAGSPVLLGTDGDDRMMGTSVGDSLEGAGGRDQLFGLEGDDRVSGGSGSDRLAGGSGSDTLYGGQGRDRLNGGSGADVAYGGLNADTFIVDQAGDQVVELAGGGADDLVRSNALRFALPDGPDGQVENALLTGAAGNGSLTGNALDNDLTGNAGDNRLSGRQGDDRLQGLDGDDRLLGGSGSDRLEGGSGSDTLFLGLDDRAFGGSGADSFVFAGPLTSGDGPVLRDFAGQASGGGDRLVMATGQESGIFAYIGAADFSGDGNSEARFAGDRRVEVDQDGDGSADLAFTISGLTQANQLTAGDFLWS
ncbi:MAG: calcium-binding protein [Pseudomonadota bacterium]